MKFSEQWLREWVNPSISAQELMDQITMAGLEVDGSEPVAGSFSGVVVGEVISAEQHPNADKLRVCQVSDGNDQFQVVCGAPNARAGIKVAFAKVGAVLPGDFKIKKAKLRQVESLGMLCSEKELELSDSHEGIMELAANAPIGEDLRSALNLNDLAIEVDLTPNRADCLSISGLAREVAVLNNITAQGPDIQPVVATIDDTFPVKLSAPKGCPRYYGRVVRNVDVTVQTPLWMVERLRRSDIRSIDPVVDITNYVMLELGQPMHGFDLDQLKGGIDVRMAKPGEKLILLDGNEVELTDDTLLITDDNGPLAMAGVMGGENSGVSAETKNVFFEAAYFDPITISGKARSYGMHTDASHRFERGVDYNLAGNAMERATQLLIDIAGGEPGPISEAVSEGHMPNDRQVSLTHDRVHSLLGIELEDQRVEQILTGLGLEVLERGEGSWVFSVPSYRFDISIEADLIEEVARIYGYNNLPLSAPVAHLSLAPRPENRVRLNQLRQILVSIGYQEAVTYSFIDPEIQALFDPEHEGIALANPISSDLAVMRTSLLPGLVKALQYNLNRQQERIRLFESGLRFYRENGEIQQEPMLAGLIYGSRQRKGWVNDGDVDFYDLKGDVEELLAHSLGNQFSYSAASITALHPGQTAKIELEGELVGYIGALHPSIQKKLGLRKPAYLFELRLGAFDVSKLPEYQEMSKFPETSRDIAVIVDESVTISQILSVVDAAAGEYLIDKVIFDVYRGKGIDPQRKSVALGLTWQHPSRTLNDDEINQWMEAVIKSLVDQFEATLRG